MASCDEKYAGSDEDTVSQTSSEKVVPTMVKSTTDSGVEDGSLKLAKMFMKEHGQLARKCTKRGELSQLYISTQGNWMPKDIQEDMSQQRPFKQILFALAHGINVVRVVDGGKSLKWNRYRNNEGEKIDVTYHRHQQNGIRYYDRRDRQDYDRRDRRDYDRRDRRDYDRRGKRDYERRDKRDYERKDQRDNKHQDSRENSNIDRKGIKRFMKRPKSQPEKSIVEVENPNTTEKVVLEYSRD